MFWKSGWDWRSWRPGSPARESVRKHWGICIRRRGNLSLFWKLTICRLWQRQMWISTILFIRPTDNARLVQLLNNLREQMYRYRIEYLKDVKARRSLVEEHDALWKALKERNLEHAQVIIREHIERQQKNIVHNISHEDSQKAPQ